MSGSASVVTNASAVPPVRRERLDGVDQRRLEVDHARARLTHEAGEARSGQRGKVHVRQLDGAELERRDRCGGDGFPDDSVDVIEPVRLHVPLQQSDVGRVQRVERKPVRVAPQEAGVPRLGVLEHGVIRQDQHVDGGQRCHGNTTFQSSFTLTMVQPFLTPAATDFSAALV